MTPLLVVPEGVGDDLLQAHDLDRLLLDAKLRAPQVRPNAVPRTHLVEVARSSARRMVAITAPAGYGKTTFLAEWACSESRRVAWVSLDRSDDDPGSLLRLLASAYARVQPDRADLVAEVYGVGSSVLGRAAPRLAAAFSASSVPFVFMLDDFHELRSPACHDVLELVIDGLPEGSQLVVASRFEQPHLPRLRAAGDVFEVIATDLALDQGAATKLFAGEDVRLSPEMAAAITERTEGWPAGLYLAAVIAKNNPEQLGVISGDDKYIADYLYEELMSWLPEGVQAFLCATAVPERVCGPLCDALLEASGGTDQLQRLEASSMFVVPIDRRRHWYRYHPLFREFLLAELRRRVSGGEIEKLHLRAADWYEANGSTELAVEHLLQAGERDRSLQMVAALWTETCSSGKLSTVLRWQTLIGPTDLQRYPSLAIMAAWSSVLAGSGSQAERWAALVRAAELDSAHIAGAASLDSTRAMLRAALCDQGPEVMRSDAAFAVSSERSWGGSRDAANWLLGEAHLMGGQLEQAYEHLVEATEQALGMQKPDTVVVSQSELALLAMDRGDWNAGAIHLERAMAVMHEHQLEDYLTTVLVFPAAARLALHGGDLVAAQAHLNRAMQARQIATHVVPFLSVRLRLESAKLHLALGSAAVARHLVREIDDILVRRPALGALVEQVDEFRDLLATSSATGSDPSPLTAAELRLLPYLQTHLTLGAIAQRLFVSRNTVSSQVTSIYRKLGVSSRREAVDRAAAVGLVGG